MYGFLVFKTNEIQTAATKRHCIRNYLLGPVKRQCFGANRNFQKTNSLLALLFTHESDSLSFSLSTRRTVINQISINWLHTVKIKVGHFHY